MILSKGASICGLLIFGTTTSLLAKIVYELQGYGINGEQKFFRKPWAMTATMFIGMTFCLPMAYIENYLQKREQQQKIKNRQNQTKNDGKQDDSKIEALIEKNQQIDQQAQNLLEIEPLTKQQSLKEIMMLSIPAIFDLIATVLMNIGLLSVTASVYQMMRGAEMIFAAIFAILFLGRKLNKYHYSGILLSVLGISAVGLASILSGQGTASSNANISKIQILVGMLLIIASQCVQAAQVTFEDYFMTDMHIDPLMIVGFEGLFGSILMIGVMLPIVAVLPGEEGNGIHEDTIDTIHMVRHSNTIPYVLLFDMFILMAYNWTGMHVTGHLGAVFRTVLETMRTLFVWVVDLILFQLPFIAGTLGEQWNIPYSFLQLVGFFILVSGTLVYGKGDEKEIKEKVSEYVASEEQKLLGSERNLENGENAVPIQLPGSQVAKGADIQVWLTPSSLPKSSMNISAGSYQAQLNYVMQHTPSFQRTELKDAEDV